MDSKSKAVLKKDYLYYEHVKTHIEQLLSKFPTLRTRLVLDPVNSMKRVILQGTIPIVFRGSNYFIPLIIHLGHDYPISVPVIQVTPTEAMLIRPTSWVAFDGSVFGPIQTSWNEPDMASKDKALLPLVRQLCELFGQEPPVVARPPGMAATQPYAYEASFYHRESLASTTTADSCRTQGSKDSRASSATTDSSVSPSTMESGCQQSLASTVDRPLPEPLSSLPTATTPVAPMTAIDRVPSPPSDLPIQTTTRGLSEMPPIRPAKPLSLDTLRSLLLDKIEARAPLVVSALVLETDALVEERRLLLERTSDLQRALYTINLELAELDSDIEKYKAKNVEIEKFLDAHKQMDVISPDDFVILKLPSQKQAFELLAEINGMEDVLYELSKALMKGDLLQLSNFLKFCRAISRAIFLKKALLKKINGTSISPDASANPVSATTS